MTDDYIKKRLAEIRERAAALRTAGQGPFSRMNEYKVDFGDNGEFGSMTFGLTEDGQMTLQLHLPDGRIAPVAYLPRDDADQLIAAWDGDQVCQREVLVSRTENKWKMLTCARTSTHLNIGLSPAVDDTDTEVWGFVIPAGAADSIMQRMPPMIRFGTEG